MRQVQQEMVSKIGPLFLVASVRGLRSVFWLDQGIPKDKEAFPEEEMILKKAVQEMTEYFEGKRKKFQVSLDIQGTEFQVRVWKRLLEIPYGETRSYKEIAVGVKAPKASRAVGTAIGKNPLCLIVPCHRVIGSDGGIGGYSGGLDIKRKLLEFEQTQLSRFC